MREAKGEEMYLYESHLGGIYATDDEMDYDDLYCEECGDSDWPIGEAETAQEAYDLLCGDETEDDYDRYRGYEPAYILPIILMFDKDAPNVPTDDRGICLLPDSKIREMLGKYRSNEE